MNDFHALCHFIFWMQHLLFDCVVAAIVGQLSTAKSKSDLATVSLRRFHRALDRSSPKNVDGDKLAEI